MTMGCWCHRCKIGWLESHLPLGVPCNETPMVRCKGCNVAVEAHRPVCPLPSTYDDHGAERCTACNCVTGEPHRKWKECPLPETYVDGRAWPATFGYYDAAGRPVHTVDEARQEYCFQCEFCQHFRPVDGDWGYCRAPGGQYEGRLSFEHFTCPRFVYDDSDDEEAYR